MYMGPARRNLRGVREHAPLWSVVSICVSTCACIVLLRRLVRHMPLCMMEASTTPGPSAGPRVGMVCFGRSASLSICCPRVRGVACRGDALACVMNSRGSRLRVRRGVKYPPHTGRPEIAELQVPHHAEWRALQPRPSRRGQVRGRCEAMERVPARPGSKPPSLTPGRLTCAPACPASCPPCLLWQQVFGQCPPQDADRCWRDPPRACRCRRPCGHRRQQAVGPLWEGEDRCPALPDRTQHAHVGRDRCCGGRSLRRRPA